MTLTNEGATRDKIRAALRKTASLEGPHDTTLVFFAGHGATQVTPQVLATEKFEVLKYFFLPHDGVVERGRVEPTSAISQDDITFEFLGKVEGRKLVLLDTCRYGEAPGRARRGLRVVVTNEMERRLGSVLAATVGDKAWTSTVYAASSDYEAALEGPEYRGGHGAFTAALMDALEGKEGFKGRVDGQIDQEQLGRWIDVRVPQTTQGRQTPVEIDASGPARPVLAITQPR